jgi:peptidoglycan/LPS O-acetylase OafA/YrhL
MRAFGLKSGSRREAAASSIADGLRPGPSQISHRSLYRADIDGLRAIAVLSVVAFHAFPEGVRGGFIGVDIFFVISGYLISSIIYRGLQFGEFSFVGFYARRVRRIFPALIVVLVMSMVAGWFVMFQDEFKVFGKNVAAAAAFVSNFASLQEAGYFGPAAGMTPLLHLWSLGIEEQFYLIWPLLVVLSSRRKLGPLAVACTVFVTSFGSNVFLVRTDPAAAFYLPVTRFWELMLGGGLAFATVPGVQFRYFGQERWLGARILYRHHAGAVHETAAWLGVALIVAALLLINPHRSFPGWWALLPTVGTTLVVSAGPTASTNRLILSRRAVVHIGLISYPLYLWHWPILVFERIVRINEPTALMKLGGIGVAFILAELTYRFVEKPVRFGTSRAARASWSIGASIALGAIACLGVLIYVEHGFPRRIPEDVLALNREIRIGAFFPVRGFQTCFLAEGRPATFSNECEGSGPTTVPRLVLWGDSHAASLYDGLEQFERAHGNATIAQYTASACPPIWSFASERRSDCPAINDTVAAKIRALNPEIVVMAANWARYEARGDLDRIDEHMIRATVGQLTAMGVKRIVVVGQVPTWEGGVPRIRMKWHRTSIAGARSAETERDKVYLRSFQSDVTWNDTVRRAVAGTAALFISPLSTFCNDDGCLLAVPGSGKSTAWDTDHLTPAAAEFLIESNAQAFLGH